MTLSEKIAQVAAANVDDVAASLENTRRSLQRVKGEADALERDLIFLERLNALAAGAEDVESVDAMTLHEAMAAVLRDQPQRRMRPVDLAGEINRRRLYRMRDGRPVEAQQLHARVGNYGDMFSKQAGFIVLAADD